METITVNIIHPTNGSYVEAELPEDMLLEDVYSQLIEADFLDPDPTEKYTFLLKPSGTRKEVVELNSTKTAKDNGIQNNDVIQIIYYICGS